ncbi:MAG: ribosomal protein S18-alanine N-acetyltransferase [Mariprofundaceae bacterium]|nr:ribosomal protein S18-alanine N-acetyltransferase [Mariprofundaceae bacterium]
MSFQYQRGDIDDIEAVFRLNRQVFAESWSKDVMLQSLQVGYDLLLCFDQGSLVAYILSQDILLETQIMQLAVISTHRRLGIAKHLMLQLLAEKKDYEQVMLEVRVSNLTAQAFYQHLNFKIVGKRPDYYVKTKTQACEDAVLLSFSPPT